MDGVHMPPISRIMDRVREMRTEGETVYSMAQAVPWYSPPAEAVDRLIGRMGEPGTHLYSPDPGLLSARKALAQDFGTRRGIELDPLEQLHLTCGASQAFLGALLAVADPGDRIVVLEPYYFDHVFAIRFSSLELVSIPMREAEGWELPSAALEDAIRDAKALVIVNPGNPTGSVLSLSELKWLVAITGDNHCYLLLDETYERFNFSGSSWHPWVDGETTHVITFGSFSKSFGISGWRLGYLFGGANILEQSLKVQDSVVICPPTPSQILLEESLRHRDWVERMSAAVQARGELCRKALETADGLEWRTSGGGFFTLAACRGRNSLEVSLELLERNRIATIPGSAFGPAGEEHVRISFGCLSDDELEPAMDALASVSL
jgi:aspartate/methionine/tyrosine aminotransferase